MPVSTLILMTTSVFTSLMANVNFIIVKLIMGVSPKNQN